MEREVLFTGIGGQGVQLAAQLLARAAVAAGRHAQLFGSYGGMMRGGNTDATLVIADQPVESPPTTASAWSGIVMHPQYAAWLVEQMRSGSLVLVNSAVATAEGMGFAEGVRTISLDVTGVAIELGNASMASMVGLGAFAAATGIVPLRLLARELPAALPPYRARHAPANVAALEAGAALVPVVVQPAWPEAISPVPAGVAPTLGASS